MRSDRRPWRGHPGRRRALVLIAVVELVFSVLSGTFSRATALAADTGSVRVPAGVSLVPDSYVVTFKDSTTVRSAREARARAQDMTVIHGGTVTATYHAALHGFAMRASAAQAATVAADSRVALVEQNFMMHLSTVQPNATWGLDRIDQPSLPLNNTYRYDTKAEGVHAYIIDTGIRATHQDLRGRVSPGVDTVGDGQNTNDCNGHGTHVAGTVGGSQWGVAKGAKLVAVRVLDCLGSGTFAGVIGGIDWVTANAVKPAVANMSLGGGAAATLDQAVGHSIASGVVYAVAAGNESSDACTVSPARTTEAITVGATSNADSRPSFSNYGSCLDIFAPGVSITSAWGTSDTATNTISGTSMATPHVTGAAALYLATHPRATPQAVRDALVSQASSSTVSNPGSGSPNKLLYTGPNSAR